WRFLLASMLLILFHLSALSDANVHLWLAAKSCRVVFLLFIESLETIQPSGSGAIESWMLNHPYWSGAIGVVVVYFLLLQVLWLASFGLRPRWLLQVSQFLSTIESRLKQTIKINLPIRRILLLSLFHFRPRVLDAWVQHYLVAARE